ncbi:hypothetical protein V8F20_011435 [Naviculisporaceae sp. PSN 640]
MWHQPFGDIWFQTDELQEAGSKYFLTLPDMWGVWDRSNRVGSRVIRILRDVGHSSTLLVLLTSALGRKSKQYISAEMVQKRSVWRWTIGQLPWQLHGTRPEKLYRGGILTTMVNSQLAADARPAKTVQDRKLDVLPGLSMHLMVSRIIHTVPAGCPHGQETSIYHVERPISPSPLGASAAYMHRAMPGWPEEAPILREPRAEGNGWTPS